jgi:surface antigen
VTDALERCVYRAFRRFGEARRLLAGGLAGICLAGCSMSFPMESLVPEDEPKATGTLVAKASSALSPELGAEDWRRAKGALAVALDPQGNGASVSWDNPDSGFKGAFTPVGHPFVKGDEICRAFVAALGRAGRDAALEGTACRLSGAEWAIKAVKPAKKAA